jgi:hypothetical protein
MTTRPGPAPERGGTPVALDSLRKKSGLKKARSTSVIAEMTRVEDETPTPAAPVVPEPVAAPGLEPARAPEPVQAQPMPVQQMPAPPAAAPAPVSAYVQPQQQPAAYVPLVQQFVPQQVQLRQPAPEPPVVEKKRYRKTSFFQSRESGARMRSAYMATRHLTGSRTLSDFILAAVEREVEALERQYNGGDRFTADPDSVPRGRPLET